MEKHRLLDLIFDNDKRLDWDTFGWIMFNATSNGLVLLDEAGTVVLSNYTARDQLKAYPGHLLKELLPEIWPEVEQSLDDCQCRYEVSTRKGKQTYRVKISPILRKTTSIGVFCIFENRTEMEAHLKQMRAYLELSQELETIFYNSYDGLWILDAEANVLRINPAAERMNDAAASEFIGKNMRELEAQGYVDKSIGLEVMESKTAVTRLQQLKNGRQVLVTVNPLFDEDGRLSRMVSNERDITEIENLRRKLEEQEAVKERLRDHIKEMRVEELESKLIIAKSPSMISVLRQAMKVAPVDSTVLLTGESGVGKGIIASLIHKYSQSKQPMIDINCGSIPETLLEAELFGYEKGAFTGADSKGKPGYFELANGGILFLDEIGDLPMSSQVKLLHFLEEGQVTRVGGTRKRTLAVRVLAATNHNLEDMVKQGKFRLDLYHRLHVIPIHIPPLRERWDCILPLVHHFLDYFCSKLNIKTRFRLTRRASDAMQVYSYPGNVRELANICERLVVMSDNPLIDIEDIPIKVFPNNEADAALTNLWHEGRSLSQILEIVEREVITHALQKYGSQSKTALSLGVNQSTVARKLKKFSLQKTP